MHPKCAILLPLLLLGFVVFAQKTPGRVSGKILSEDERKPLSDATVSLYRDGDSTVERMVITDSKGGFNVSALRTGGYKLLVTLIGYRTGQKSFTLTEAVPRADLGDIILQIRSDSLEEVLIVRQKPPLVIKPDTLEYNASAFKTKDNDMTEELLRKIPGLEVGRDGSIKANGQNVTKVLVDGKPFFGNDPRMATQNLPADIIDKVQVIDEKSDQARVTKIDDGKVDKVINITIKKDKKKGSFGRGYAGYGTDDHYEAKATANRFLGDRKMSAVLTSNNTGRADYSNGMNEDNGNYNTNGINTDHNLRFNFTDGWKDKYTVSVNGGYNDSRNRTEQERRRINILGDSTTSYDETSTSYRTRKGFNSGLSFQGRPDTLTWINLNGNANWARSTYGQAADFRSESSSLRKINAGMRRNETGSRTPSFNGNLSLNRSLKKKGRGIFLNLSSNVNNNLGEASTVSSNIFYPVNGPEYNRLVNQLQNNENRSSSWNGSISYNDAISRKWSWSTNIHYSRSRNNTIREALDFNPATNLYDLLNDSISTRYNTYTTGWRYGAGLSYNMKKGAISFSGSWQDNRNRNVVLDNDSTFVQRIRGFVPQVSFRRYGTGQQLQFSYTWDNRAPQPYQLQPVIDNSNPLYIRYGNPNLKFSVAHRLNYSMNWFRKKDGLVFNTNGNVSYTTNAIVNATTFDKATGVQTSRPVNRDGQMFGYTNFYLTKPFQWMGNRNSVSVNVSLNYSRNLSLLNGEENRSVNFGQNINPGVNLDLKDWGSLRMGLKFGRNTIMYSLQTQQDNTTYTYGTDANLRLTPNKMTDLSISWDFNKRTGGNFTFTRPVHLVNVVLNQYFNKKKNTWLKFQVYDLLKQYSNISRFGTDSFIEDVRTNGLTRFVMVSFNAKFNKFGPGARGKR